MTDGVSSRTSVRRPSEHGAARVVNVRLRQRLSLFAAPPRRLKDHARRQLLANAAIAASRVSSLAVGSVCGLADLIDRVLNPSQNNVVALRVLPWRTTSSAASLGAVGLDWQVGGFAVDPPTGSMGEFGWHGRFRR